MTSRTTIIFAMVFLATQLVGCRLYVRHPVTIHVRDAETQEPVSGIEIQARHFAKLDFGLLLLRPHKLIGSTDENGEVTLHFDPTKDNLHLSTDAKDYIEHWMLQIKPQHSRFIRRSPFSLHHDYYWHVYRNPSSSLNLTIPDGYQGVVLVEFAKEDTPPAVKGQRQFNYAVGSDGRVTIRERTLLHNHDTMKRVTAHRTDGTKVPFVELGKTWTGNNEPNALRYISPVESRDGWLYVVGTEAEAVAIDKSLWGDGKQGFNEAAFRELTRHRP